MQKTDENIFANAAPVAEVPPVAEPARATPGHVSGIGQWAFDHRASFSKQSPVAWYGIRNVVANMTGIAALIGVIVGVRKGMGHGAQWAQEAGHTFLSNELSRVYTQNAVGVGASFATFRTVYKMFQRSYDDVFVKPKSAEESSAAISNMPHKLWQDFKQIGVVEYPVTMIGGFVLVGIRSGIAGAIPKETLAKKNFLEVVKDKHIQRDIAGCALFGYPAFFEIIERLGGSWQKERGFDDAATNEHRNKHKQGMKETFLRQIPGVAAGIVPYIALNSWGYHNGGRQLSFNTAQREAAAAANTVAKIDSFGAAYKKEMPYQYFWTFSLGRDLYFDAYDKLTGKRKVETGEKHPAFPGVHAQEAEGAGRSSAPVVFDAGHHKPGSRVGDVDAQGKAVVHKPTVAVSA